MSTSFYRCLELNKTIHSKPNFINSVVICQTNRSEIMSCKMKINMFYFVKVRMTSKRYTLYDFLIFIFRLYNFSIVFFIFFIDPSFVKKIKLKKNL